MYVTSSGFRTSDWRDAIDEILSRCEHPVDAVDLDDVDRQLVDSLQDMWIEQYANKKFRTMQAVIDRCLSGALKGQRKGTGAREIRGHTASGRYTWSGCSEHEPDPDGGLVTFAAPFIAERLGFERIIPEEPPPPGPLRRLAERLFPIGGVLLVVAAVLTIIQGESFAPFFYGYAAIYGFVATLLLFAGISHNIKYRDEIRARDSYDTTWRMLNEKYLANERVFGPFSLPGGVWKDFISSIDGDAEVHTHVIDWNHRDRRRALKQHFDASPYGRLLRVFSMAYR